MRFSTTFRRPLLKRLAAAAALSAATAAQAWIAPGTTGNGELFVSVFSANAKVSYTKDLGITQDAFFVSAQQDGGSQSFWNWNRGTDLEWDRFLTLADPADTRWTVQAFDSTGGIAVGKFRWFTTITQGLEAILVTPIVEPGSYLSNLTFGNGIGSSQAGQFFNAVNTTGTHGVVGTVPDYSINGSSANLESDTGKSYYGEAGGTSDTLNGNAPFTTSNSVGDSSFFYYVTRSGNDNGAAVLVDEFDNIAPGVAGDGYFGFVYVDPALYPTSIYAGDWLLSYTLAGAPGFSAASRQFAAAIGRTEFDGSFAVARLDGAAAAGTETAAGLSQRLFGAAVGPAPAALAVPEPERLALMAAGLALVGAAARRRR